MAIHSTIHVAHLAIYIMMWHIWSCTQCCMYGTFDHVHNDACVAHLIMYTMMQVWHIWSCTQLCRCDTFDHVHNNAGVAHLVFYWTMQTLSKNNYNIPISPDRHFHPIVHYLWPMPYFGTTMLFQQLLYPSIYDGPADLHRMTTVSNCYPIHIEIRPESMDTLHHK